MLDLPHVASTHVGWCLIPLSEEERMLDLDVQTVTGAVVTGIVVLVTGGILLAAMMALGKAWKTRY